MTFFGFKKDDIIQTSIVTHPVYDVELNGDQVTGSIYLEKRFLDTALEARTFTGFSAKQGGIVSKTGPFTASIDIVDAELGSTNSQLFESIKELYSFYAFDNSNYTSDFTGSDTTRFRVITVPEIYYDREILTGSLTASDNDSAGDSRTLYDDGLGGVYSGSLTGTLVGNIFYSEGLIVLKGGGLNDEAGSNDFGESSPTNFAWKVAFKGVHTIPVKIFKCRAPGDQLNASTNSTYFQVPSGSTDKYKHEKEIVLTEKSPYVTTVGLFNEHYELVGMAKLSQPIKKEEGVSILFRLRQDW